LGEVAASMVAGVGFVAQDCGLVFIYEKIYDQHS
jgi:hypothetical protein